MRLISLVFALAIIAWLVYTYMGSNTVIKTDSDKTVKEQVVETMDEARESANKLQKSLHEQAKQIQNSEQ